MCAITAGKRGRSVALLEHNERVGKKILISGGGRCNFTNYGATADNYVTSGSPHFCKSAMARYTPAQFITWVEQHGIAYHEKKLGQLFCDHSSKQIVDMLEAECAAARVKIVLNCRVTDVRKSERFEIETSQGVFTATSLVIATGGLSFPKLGATDFGYRLADRFGIQLVKPRPGLVPLTVPAVEQGMFGELSGLSVDTVVTGGKARFRENILFTHRGLSGPAILQISSHVPEGATLEVDLFPEEDALAWLKSQQREAKELKTVLGMKLPQRFVQMWCSNNVVSKPMNRHSPKELEALAHTLKHWSVKTAGTEGYPKAEVTLGGVHTDELSSKTMEARKAPGLFFIGEVVDVTGWLGGYNFQWAWASGHAAGQAV